jgi:hypothetical protein
VTMSGENNRITPLTEGTSRDVEKKQDTPQEAPAVNPEAESASAPAAAAAAPKATEESDRPTAEGINASLCQPLLPRHAQPSFHLLTLFTLIFSSTYEQTDRVDRRET